MIKKLLFLVLFSFSLASINAQAVWNNTSFVHRSNKQILDGQGNVISLDGVNLGGWLMWEGWIWGGGYTQQKTIYNNIKSVVGTPAADTFVDSVNKNFISKKDIQKISEECYNVVRIPFNSSLLEDDFTPYVYKPAGWAVLDSVLGWCEQYNVYAILDMHSAPGGQSNSFTADPDLFINLWNGTVNQKRTKLMWKAIANRYKNRGIIAAYDLLNEPSTSSDSAMVDMFNQITDSIRTVDPNHMVSIEGNSYATDFSMFTTLHDPNTSFQFHFYTWFFPNAIATHLNTYTTFSNAINAPVWCGEWGENSYAQLDTTRSLLRDPLYGVSGNAFWTWKKMIVGSAYRYYNGVDTSTNWLKTIKWAGNTSLPQPTVAEMQAGISEFIQNMKADACTFNDTLSDILRTCVATGITDPESSADINVYPNPAQNVVTIAFENEISTATVFLSDVQGKLISTTVIQHSNKTLINTAHLSPGIYFIRINCNDGNVYNHKIVVSY